MIICVAGFKGGIGKTTTAVHLANFFQTLGPTLYMDSDENRSGIAWAKRGNFPFESATETTAPQVFMKMRPDYVVIDTKARPNREDLQELAEQCDLMILPTTPNPLDMEQGIKTARSISELGANYRLLLTMVQPTASTSSNNILEQYKKLNIPFFSVQIRRYAFIGQLPLTGKLVSESRDKNAKSVWQDFKTLGKEACDVITNKK
ncbi:ParA family protein [Okeania sp. SIO2G5]|uniref:ParA family protein n=1 Tax=Okeania sp. SIO2G5 TaxID=2607796 RepID=UPI00257F6362|nr:ParA family protein [Okeania sp. SIO2G5]